MKGFFQNMNLTSQYIVNPKVTKAYSNSNATYQSIQSSYTKIRLNETRARLRPNNLRKVSFGVSGITFKMIICPKGTFTMGADVEDDNNPKRVVSINKPFLLGETEVTQELFEKVMGFNTSWHQGEEYSDSNKRPVDNVTSYEAVMFCNKLSEIMGKKPYYNISNVAYEIHNIGKIETFTSMIKANVTINPHSNGFRLPFGNEWEYAAKAGTNNRWAGTNDPKRVGEIAWYKDNSEDKTHPVKGKRPNEWGFYDMTGNVREWCWDERNNSLRQYVAYRGGSFCQNASRLRCAHLGSNFLPNDRYSEIGFRVSASLFN
jgi:sulfatase modifying factor 1